MRLKWLQNGFKLSQGKNYLVVSEKKNVRRNSNEAFVLTINSLQTLSVIYFHVQVARKNKETRQEWAWVVQEEIGCTELLCLCSRTYSVYNSSSNIHKLGSKGPNKISFEDSANAPSAMKRKVSKKIKNVTQINPRL